MTDVRRSPDPGPFARLPERIRPEDRSELADVSGPHPAAGEWERAIDEALRAGA